MMNFDGRKKKIEKNGKTKLTGKRCTHGRVTLDTETAMSSVLSCSNPHPQQLIDFIPVKMGWWRDDVIRRASKIFRSFLLGAAHITTDVCFKTCASGRIVSSVKKRMNTYTHRVTLDILFSRRYTQSHTYCQYLDRFAFLLQIYRTRQSGLIFCVVCIDLLFSFSLRTTYTDQKMPFSFVFFCCCFFFLLFCWVDFLFHLRNNKKQTKI